MRTVEIYTDGSCKVATKAKTGTCAIVVVDGQKVLYQKGYKHENTTNNRMELMGCIEALKWAKGNCDTRVYVHTDSQYVQLGITEWIHNWKLKNYRTAGKKDVQNKDLWIELDELRIKLPYVQFQWVRGHNNNKFNEMADKLCNETYISSVSPVGITEAEELLIEVIKCWNSDDGEPADIMNRAQRYLKLHNLIQ